MTTTLAERQAFSIEPITYPVIADKLAELSAEYMPLRINGLQDTQGLKAVHSARMVVKNLRVNIEKRRKELKSSSLEYGRQVDAAAKQLFDLLEPIEGHLQSEEDAVENERARIKREAEEARRLALQKRIDSLAQFGIVAPLSIGDLEETDFQETLASARAAFEERQRRESEAAEMRRAEEAALNAERERLAEIQRKQDEEAARLKAERLRIEQVAADHRRALEIEKARKDAAEKARIETEQRIAREQIEAQHAAERKAAQEKAELELQEAARLKAERERPQREKLLAVAHAVDLIEVPEGPGSTEVNRTLEQCAVQIRIIANGPLA